MKTELSDEEFFRILRDSAASSGYRLGDKFIGYFLQFKAVKKMQVRKKYTPASIVNRRTIASPLTRQRTLTQESRNIVAESLTIIQVRTSG